jgi:transcriptional regulator with XRE-family HTH domain
MHTRTTVRRLRKSIGLAQHELATLLGVNQSAVSRIEAGTPPEVDHLLALHILFDTPAHVLFAGRHEAVGEEVARRAAELERTLQRQRNRHAERKRSWLRDMIRRITVCPA